MGDGPLGFPPDVLDCIEFRGTGREEMEFNEIFLAVEPLPDFGRFVIRCVVGDKVDLDSAVVPHQLAEKVDERRCVEHRYEARMPLWLGADPYCAHDLDALANRRTEYVNSDSHERPCPDDGSGLLKDSFVLIEHYASVLFGFFLMAGSSSSRQVCWAFSSAFERFLPGYCTASRSPCSILPM